MKIVLLTLFFIFSTAQAVEFDDNFCNSWIKNKTRKPLVKLSALTEKNAKKALKTLNRMVSETAYKKSPYVFEALNYKEAEITLRGYLLRKEIEDGWKFKQPDPAQYDVLCDFWSKTAFN